MKKFLNKSPFYYFLFAIYPIIFLYSINFKEVDFVSVIRPALIFLVIASVIFFVILAVNRNVQRSSFYSLITLLTFFLVFFFLYAPAYRALRNVEIAGAVLGRHRLLVPLTLILLVIISVIFLVFGKKISRRILNNVSSFLNLAASILTIISVFVISSSLIKSFQKAEENQALLPIDQLKVDQSTVLPDIYYLILDMHTNDNVLSRLFKYDDTGFTQELEKRGFFVSQCSESNYDDTGFSLSTSLNYEYLQDYDAHVGAYDALKNSRVSRMLKNIGYSTYAFETGYSVTEVTDADHYYPLDRGGLKIITYPGVTSFESLILRISAGQVLYEYRDGLSYKLQVIMDAPFVDRREMILNVFDTLPEIATQPGPKFVFAHVIAPHQPFVFDENGGPTFRRTPFSDFYDAEYESEYDWEQAYIAEIIYLHKRVIEVVDKIKSESETPPIIIIQGDHGVPLTKGYNAQFQILNAYHFPNTGNAGLYNTISPVNSYRVLFNDYFKMNYPMLPDVSYIQQEKFYLADKEFPCP